VVTLAPDKLLAAVRRLKTELGFDLLLDVTAVDWPERTPRFDVVYHFYSTAHHVRVRVKTGVPESDPHGRLARSAVRLRRFMERECHDMYGIVFAAIATCGRSCSTKASSATRCARTTAAHEQPLAVSKREP
jgi:NADH-quinone oxidoreductase subunit C